MVLLILKLQAITPPNALIGSHAYAFLKAVKEDLFVETPQGLACLTITVEGFFPNDNNISKAAKLSL